MSTYNTASEIEIILSNYIDIRRNLVVPNVSWGLSLHECDVLSMTHAGYLTEYEIKVSASDLKKDLEKRHGHKSDKIKFLYFVIPSRLAKYIEFIPERAGVLVVNSKGKIFKIADAKPNVRAQALTEKEKYELARLGALRIWGLKRKIENLNQRRKNENFK